MTPAHSNRHHTVDELDHGVVERIVLVAGHHVAGTGDIRDLEVRDQALQLAYADVAHDVADPAAHEQRWDVDPAGGVAQPAMPDVAVLAVDALHVGDETRVPMPVPAAVAAQTQVLTQAGEVFRSRAMWQVGGNRVGCLLA